MLVVSLSNFCHPFGSNRTLPFSCHVLWSICCHLQTATLHDSNEQKTLHSTCPMFLVLWLFHCHCAPCNDSPAAFLHLHQSLLLWLYGTVAFVLFRHTFHRSDWVCLCCLYPHLHLDAGDSFLYIHYQDSSENPICSTNKKAFATCSSHMIVVSLSYGSCVFMCINPSVEDAATFSKGVAVLNTSVAPLLYPFICTLRNKQVKIAFKHLVSKLITFSKK